MKIRSSLGYITVVLLFACTNNGCLGSLIVMDGDGGYTGIVVAISPDVTDRNNTLTIINNLKALITKASAKLTKASNSGWYFKKVSFLLPPGSNWTEYPKRNAGRETYREADILVGDFEAQFATDQPRECGKPGDVIRLDSSWLMNLKDDVDKTNAAHQFLQQWAKFRYGVFDEFSVKTSSYDLYPDTYIDQNGKRQKTGCTEENVWTRGGNCDDDDSAKCSFTLGINTTVPFSLMDDAVLKATDFCGNENHNKDAPTPQNALCEGKSLWQVIKTISIDKDVKVIKEVDKDGKAPTSSEPKFDYIIMQPPKIYIILDPDLCKKPNVAMRLALKKLFTSRGNMPESVTTLIIPHRGNGSINVTVTNDYMGDIRSAIDDCNGPSINLETEMRNFLSEIKKEYDPEKEFSIWLTNPNVIRSLSQETRPPLSLYALTYNVPSTENLNHDVIDALAKSKWYNIPFSKSAGSVCDLNTWMSTEEAFFDIFQRHLSDHFYPTVALKHSEICWDGHASGIINVEANSRVCMTMHCCDQCDTVVTIDGEKIENTPQDPNFMEVKELCVEDPGRHIYNIQTAKNPQSFFLTIREEVNDSAGNPLLSVRTMVDPVVVKTKNSNIIVNAIRALVRDKGKHKIGAKVEAVLHMRGFDDQKFELQDNGNGDPDLFKDDGIYSSYIIPKMKGVYAITVELKDDVVNAGSVSFSQSLEDYKTTLPPSRIVDLHVESIKNSTVTFSWTTPGEHLDQGAASSILHIVCSATFPQKLASCQVNEKKNNTGKSVSAGKCQTLSMNFAHELYPCSSALVYRCTIFAINSDGNNNSKPSNFVIVRISKNNNTVGENTVETTTSTSLPTSSASTTESPATRIIIISCSVAVSVLLLILIIVLLIIHREKLPCRKGVETGPVTPRNIVPKADSELTERLPQSSRINFRRGKSNTAATPANKTDTPQNNSANRMSTEEETYVDPETLTRGLAKPDPVPVPIENRPPILPPTSEVNGEAYDEIGTAPMKRTPGRLPPLPLNSQKF